MMLRTPAAKRPRWAVVGALPDEDEPGTLVQFDPGAVQACEESADPEDEDEDVDWDSMRCSYKCKNMVKSELMETFELRERQMKEYETALEALKAKLNDTEYERQKLVGQVKVLEQTAAAATAQEQALRSQRSEEVQQGEDRFRKQLIRCSELQDKLQTEIRLRSEAESAARAANTEAASVKEELRAYKLSSARDIQRLHKDIKHLQGNNQFNVTEMEAKCMAERREVENAVEDLALARAEYEELQTRMNEVMNEKRELERELSKTYTTLATSRIIESQEAEAVIKSLREELNHQSAEIAEAKKIKESRVRLEVLQEQLEMEKKRAVRAEAELEKNVDMQFRVTALEAEVQAWEDAISAIPGNLGKEDVAVKFSNLQRELLMVIAENGTLKAQVTELKSALQSASAEKEEAISSATSSRRDFDEAHSKHARLERQVASLTRERNGLSAVLASYDQEESSLLHQPGTPYATPEKSKQKRIEELEDVLSSSQQTIQSLETERERTLEALKMHQEKCKVLDSDLSLAQSRIAALGNEAAQLQKEIEMLEGKVARGEFDPSKTRVLKLKETQDAVVSTSKATEEGLMYDTCDQISSIIENKRTIAILNDKVRSLEHEIFTLKKREKRYMQVFAEKVFTFRTACGLIFGYEIVMNENPDSAVTLFKLRSIYSRDKENEVLEFQYTADKQCINMLGNDYTSSPDIQRQVVTFVQGFKSVPAFVANLTLELFNRGTIG